MTPYWRDEKRGLEIYHGDCLEIVPALGREWPVICCDPPYWTLPDDFLAPLVAGAEGAALFGYPEDLCGFIARTGLAPTEWVTWWPRDKKCARGNRGLPKSSEHIAFWGAISDAQLMRKRNAVDSWILRMIQQRGKSPTHCREDDVWTESSGGTACNGHLRDHPNQKPVAVVLKVLQLLPDGVTLDMTCGSGTTLVACYRLGRQGVGIEISEEYCELAARRLEAEIAQGRLFEPAEVAQPVQLAMM